MAERLNIVQSSTEPNKRDIWLKNGKFKKFGAKGWSSIGDVGETTEPIYYNIEDAEIEYDNNGYVLLVLTGDNYKAYKKFKEGKLPFLCIGGVFIYKVFNYRTSIQYVGIEVGHGGHPNSAEHGDFLIKYTYISVQDEKDGEYVKFTSHDPRTIVLSCDMDDSYFLSGSGEYKKIPEASTHEKGGVYQVTIQSLPQNATLENVVSAYNDLVNKLVSSGIAVVQS